MALQERCSGGAMLDGGYSNRNRDGGSWMDVGADSVRRRERMMVINLAIPILVCRLLNVLRVTSVHSTVQQSATSVLPTIQATLQCSFHQYLNLATRSNTLWQSCITFSPFRIQNSFLSVPSDQQ